MGAKSRTPSSNLKSSLLKESYSYSFLQALRLLHLLIIEESDLPPEEVQAFARLKIRPHLSLDFPASDIHTIEQDPIDPDKYILTVTFLGLYGSSSPLPPFYTEDLLHDQSDGDTLSRDFIDLCNAPLYQLLYKSWSKYQLFLNLYENKNEAVLERLLCFLGLSGVQLSSSEVEPFGLLRYIGLITPKTRSAEGLQNLLSDHLDEPSLRVLQCQSRVVTIPEDERCYLGRLGSRLGQDCHLGSELLDRMGKFRIVVEPENNEACRRLLPGRDSYREMAGLIDFYLDKPLDWDLVIRFKRSNIKTACLGKTNWSCLGWDTWLQSDSTGPVSLDVTV